MSSPTASTHLLQLLQRRPDSLRRLEKVAVLGQAPAHEPPALADQALTVVDQRRHVVALAGTCACG